MKRVGRPEIPASKRRIVAFRFVATKEEAVKVREAARAAGKTLSEYLRSVAIPR
jgi:hypothetical protein